MKISIIKKHIAVLLSISVCSIMLCLPIAVTAEESKGSVISVENVKETTENAFENYIGKYASEPYAAESITVQLNNDVETNPIIFTVNVKTKGLYTIGMTYQATGSGIDDLMLAFSVDDNVPFAEAEGLLFPRFWKDEEDSRTDSLGNEFAAKQVPFDKARYACATDIKNETNNPYYVFLSAGSHKIMLQPKNGTFKLSSFIFGTNEQPKSYIKPSNYSFTKQKTVVIDGEDTFIKNDYGIPSKSDNSSADINPHSATKTLINYIGGENWNSPGQTIVWQTPELTEGYYQIGFSFRQSYLIGGKVYRNLKIDGKTPFAEASTVPFKYSDNWQKQFFANDDNDPYLIYFSEGVHEISLTVVPGNMSKVQNLLNSAVAELGSLYIDITMITGETPDTYRDYDLFSQISDMEQRLTTVSNQLDEALKLIQNLSGQNSGTNQSTVQNMQRIIKQMLSERYSAHRYKSEYYTQYTSLAATLYDMKNMPLDIDEIILTPPETGKLNKVGIFEKCWFSILRFFVSFVRDYSGVSTDIENKDSVTVWVQWGRDQAQVLNLLSQSEFTAKNGISVNVQLVNASIIQAAMSGKGPDVILQYPRTEPVNLAMRGALYDLTQFDDLDSVLKCFNKDAEIPYRYKNGLYALPDTQTFFLMFYRKDILSELGFKIPETWDDFKELSSLLARRNLQVWIPNNPATNVEQSNAGVGSINIFPSLIMQNGLSLYSKNGKSTTLTTPGVMKIFSEWTDFYRKYRIDTAMDFYNRFRTGVCPIGISPYIVYTTLKAAAPEIDGLWSVAPIPGTIQEDGTISHISSGGGTGCAILADTKNPDASWKFLKWWTDADTQINFSNEVEAVLGPAGRIAPSNVEAFKNLSWDADMKEQILDAWNQVVEIPEYPGSYYVSRSVYQSFWNVVDANKNPKDMLLKYGKQADAEIQRKWKQYDNR